jgi:hypothetical protein
MVELTRIELATDLPPLNRSRYNERNLIDELVRGLKLLNT